MKALPLNVSSFPYVSTRLDGRPVVEQISELMYLNEILTDAFMAAYQSEHFRLGDKHTRFKISSLQTAFNLVTKGLIESSLEGVSIDQQVDWNRLEVNQAVGDLGFDIDTYLEYSSAFISVFDCFFNDDSMKGESPTEFIERCHETRNFFLSLLGACLRKDYSYSQG